MSTSVGNSGSLIDVQGVVSQLMQIEARPLNIAKQRVSTVDTSISAMSQVKSLVDAAANSAASIEDRLMLTGRSLVNSDANLVSANVSNSSLASPGTYVVSDQKIAQGQRTAFAGFRSVVDSLGYAGELFIQSDSTDYGAISKRISLVDMTLEQIRDTINNESSLSGKITASIINTGDFADGQSLGYVLVLSGAKTGSSATFTASWDQSAAIFNPGSLVVGRAEIQANPEDSDGRELNQTAADAQVRVNNILLRSKTNVFSEAIAGVSFEIKKNDSSVTGATLTVRDNRETLKERVRKLAADLTALNQRLVSLTKPGSKDEKGGALAGNAGILSLSSSLSSNYISGFTITSNEQNYSWSKLGLEWNRSGSVTIREADLSTAIDGELGVAMLGGFTSSISAMLAKFRGPAGSLQSSLDVLQSNRSRLSTSVDDLENRLERTRAKLVAKYAALDARLTSMNQMSANVRSSLASLG